MDIPSYGHVLVELTSDRKVAIVKYNRPQSGNSLRPEVLADMLAAFKWVDNHPDVRVIIQTGTGKFFSTGMDLDVDNSSSSPSLGFSPGSDFHEMNRILILSEKVLIAAVNGPAVGYGVSSLGLFDLVYSVPDAYFFTPFVKWAMAAEGASSFAFPKLMGHQKTANLFLAGDRITAQEASQLGLVSKILEKDNFLGAVMEIAERIAQSPPGSLRATKRLMKAPVLQDLLDANDRECDVLQNERRGSDEYWEAIKKFKVEQEARKKLKSKI
ncbi:ClpP/crotonase-like domain-containing protein [Xylogone sp. PMI_703]|nr:ClpP/crotonase-like domain-containing protein [Xylogone sp. PMI_703]